MAVTLTINGVPYSFPQTGEENWGPPVTAAAVGLAEVTETLHTPATDDIATQGVLRLGSADGVFFRNNANNANLGLTISPLDELLFDGNPIGGTLPPFTFNRAIVSDGAGALVVSPTTDAQIGFLSTVTSNVQTQLDALVAVDVGLQSQINTKLETVTDTATIDLTKTGVDLSAAIVAGSITNTQINASAAIAVTKLAAVTASKALVSDGSGFISPSATSSAEIGFVAGVTSPIQTQINNINTTITSLVFLSNGPPNLGIGYI